MTTRARVATAGHVSGVICTSVTAVPMVVWSASRSRERSMRKLRSALKLVSAESSTCWKQGVNHIVAAGHGKRRTS